MSDPTPLKARPKVRVQQHRANLISPNLYPSQPLETTNKGEMMPALSEPRPHPQNGQSVESNATVTTISHVGDGMSGEPSNLGLIPSELPPSPFLYVLTTSEGRDKLFKCLQYFLKLLIWILTFTSLFPDGSRSVRHEWGLRFAGNIQTIRNGRTLFKLGRWLVTVFYLQETLDLLCPSLLELVKQCIHTLSSPLTNAIVKTKSKFWSFYQKLFSWSRKSQPRIEMGRSRSGEDITSEALQQSTTAITAGEKMNKERKASSEGLPKHEEEEESNKANKEKLMSSSVPKILLLSMTLRCSFHVVKSFLRDYLFLRNKEFLGMKILSYERRSYIQSIASKAWFCVSLCDLIMHSYRLLDRNWIEVAVRGDESLHCQCSITEDEVDQNMNHIKSLAMTSNSHTFSLSKDKSAFFRRRKASCCFPRMDLNMGCPTTGGPHFFEAVDPKDMPLICGLCHHPCVPNVRRGSLHSQHTHRRGTENAITLISAIPPPALHTLPALSSPRRRMKLLLPWMIRKAYSLWWCMTEHANFTQTLLLQIKYMADTYLSLGYALGSFEVQNEDEDPLAQHLHISGSIAGLISSWVAARRVYLAAEYETK